MYIINVQTLILTHLSQFNPRNANKKSLFWTKNSKPTYPTTSLQKRAIQRAKNTKMSLWLNILPVAKHHYDLSTSKFQDALALRYKKPLLQIPGKCDGCGSPFDLSHALSCCKGGLVIQRHNEIRDTFNGDLSALVWGTSQQGACCQRTRHQH